MLKSDDRDIRDANFFVRPYGDSQILWNMVRPIGAVKVHDEDIRLRSSKVRFNTYTRFRRHFSFVFR